MAVEIMGTLSPGTQWVEKLSQQTSLAYFSSIPPQHNVIQTVININGLCKLVVMADAMMVWCHQ